VEKLRVREERVNERKMERVLRCFVTPARQSLTLGKLVEDLGEHAAVGRIRVHRCHQPIDIEPEPEVAAGTLEEAFAQDVVQKVAQVCLEPEVTISGQPTMDADDELAFGAKIHAKMIAEQAYDQRRARTTMADHQHRGSASMHEGVLVDHRYTFRPFGYDAECFGRHTRCKVNVQRPTASRLQADTLGSVAKQMSGQPCVRQTYSDQSLLRLVAPDSRKKSTPAQIFAGGRRIGSAGGSPVCDDLCAIRRTAARWEWPVLCSPMSPLESKTAPFGRFTAFALAAFFRDAAGMPVGRSR
jgi:hypothetical protein